MGIIVNAQAGSIINNYDIHDNEVVNVGINGEVHETSEIREEDAPRELPYELSTPTAMGYWKKLRDGGWVDEHWQRTEKMSLSAAGFTVHCFAQVLNLDGGWADFEKFWNCSNLRQEYDKSQYRYPQKCESLKIIFDL